jgi:type VI secretion system protein ImpF
MARSESEPALTPSLLDRLIDPDSGGSARKHGFTEAEMVDAVQRDLEDLLNTRQSYSHLPEHFADLETSILTYGLPDLTSLAAHTPQQRAAIGRVLEEAVAKFEPRLREVRATLSDPGDGKDRSVRFRIDAKLNVDPAPEVAFETVLELTTGRYSVQQTGT